MDKEQEKMDALFQLLDELLEYPIETSDDISDAELETYFKKFSRIYCNKFRHWYSLISDYLGKRTPDVYSTLDNGLRLIADYGKRVHPKSDEVNAGIDKLLDHVDLESVRIDRMEAVRCLLMKQKIYMRQPYNLLVTLKIRLWKCKKMLNTTMSSLYLY